MGDYDDFDQLEGRVYGFFSWWSTRYFMAMAMEWGWRELMVLLYRRNCFWIISGWRFGWMKCN